MKNIPLMIMDQKHPSCVPGHYLLLTAAVNPAAVKSRKLTSAFASSSMSQSGEVVDSFMGFRSSQTNFGMDHLL